MQVPSYAKINWSLRIVRKREDGYHDIDTVFQTISLADTLTFERADRFALTCSDRTIPVDDRNLVAKAARALGADRVAIHIEKRIPAGGGLGGGSSNAAVTLMTLSKMFSIDAPLDQLALKLGSDVPFFLIGGRAHGTGRGEILTPLPDIDPVPLLLVMPRERVSTREAFQLVWRPLPSAVAVPLGAAAPTNDFEEPIFARYPRLREYKQRLLQAGATFAAMSGSGSTIFGVFADDATRDAARATFADVRTEPATTVGRA
jgi:4-diphosphocytidyl-2-C-methyl-D-erythritol kinase